MIEKEIGYKPNSILKNKKTRDFKITSFFILNLTIFTMFLCYRNIFKIKINEFSGGNNMQRKTEVCIGSIKIQLYVIAFALKAFTSDEIAEISAYIDKYHFMDDLIEKGGQITQDSKRGIFYTGSALVARWIAATYGRVSLSKKYSVEVFRENISGKDLSKIRKSSKKKNKKEVKPFHNLQPVLDTMKSEMTI